MGIVFADCLRGWKMNTIKNSCIYQISTKPIDKKDYICESTFESTFYDNSFLGIVADYVNENTNREKDIQRLVNCYEEYGIKYSPREEYVVFRKGFKEKYFQEKYKAFEEAVNQLTFDVFVNNIYVYSHKVKALIEDKFSFWVYTNHCFTFDYFVRNIIEEKKYYIGATIGYHAC